MLISEVDVTVEELAGNPSEMRGRSGGGGGGVGGGGGGGGGARMRLHKRRPGHRRPTQHHVASSVEPVCDMRKVVNGVVSVDQDKLNKLVQREPIDDHYAVEEEPFARYSFPFQILSINLPNVSLLHSLSISI